MKDFTSVAIQLSTAIEHQCAVTVQACLMLQSLEVVTEHDKSSEGYVDCNNDSSLHINVDHIHNDKLCDWVDTWSNQCVFSRHTPAQVINTWASIGVSLIHHRRAAEKAKEKIEALEKEKLGLVNTNSRLKDSNKRLNEENYSLIKEKIKLEAKNNSLKSQLGFQAHKLENLHDDAEIPSIVDRAMKACGDDINKVTGYLAAEVSRLRSVVSKLRTRVTELEAEE